MLALRSHEATDEQLPIISGIKMGIEVIRGAAGSGKTSTALLRLDSLAHTFLARRKRLKIERPVRMLVLTFNRTLAGYVEHLASEQLSSFNDVSCEILTFAAWGNQLLESPPIIDGKHRESLLTTLGRNIPLPTDFLLNEIEYICGRFRPKNRNNYLSLERTGRGNSPAVPRTLRPELLKLIDDFYILAPKTFGTDHIDWHQVTEKLLEIKPREYDIVIIDEAQDFSANQIRAIRHHLSSPYCLTLVLDTAQRLYPRGFTWSETGLEMSSARYHRLKKNHRNTIEIAKFAAGILDNLNFDDDGTLPDFSAATGHGLKPIVCKGLYSEQLKFSINWIKKNIDISKETVAFLKPKGGQWFKEIRNTLALNKLDYVEITKDRNWPQGEENIALSTMHSAKGLEFDHVIILGLSDRNTPHGEDAEDDELLLLRRLLAMALGRARKTVIVGYKPEEQSDLVDFFKNGTFDEVNV
ncbi:3'-5' exonuclease [Pseudomonas gingeri]|uniref:3'-5' exonuclease n=1 Tax=Pseudomonas gingeri TaxID=117681 RepID=UPI0015B7AEAB|nr:3'-5' exonuclease [Pseudomonas gingeri]NWD47485.1 AAA family ATPase [Pseudomonas gingeri]NWE72770.1 AAA family ATPase [Pseudomonas gingeri]